MTFDARQCNLISFSMILFFFSFLFFAGINYFALCFFVFAFDVFLLLSQDPLFLATAFADDDWCWKNSFSANKSCFVS